MKSLYTEINGNLKESEIKKKEIMDSCSDLIKDFEKFFKNILKNSEKIEINKEDSLSQELNHECIVKKNHIFKRIDTEFCNFQEAIDTSHDQISQIKYNYFMKTMQYISLQTYKMDELVEDG